MMDGWTCVCLVNYRECHAFLVLGYINGTSRLPTVCEGVRSIRFDFEMFSNAEFSRGAYPVADFKESLV
jgi:hypothetical protein